MSLYFDFVINCDLKSETDQKSIEAITCLVTPDYELSYEPVLNYRHNRNIENAWDFFGDFHFLAPDPSQEVISHFERRHRYSSHLTGETHRYCLQYAARWLNDDYAYSHHFPFIEWLATVSHDVCMGYYGQTESNDRKFLMVRRGKLHITT